MVHATRFRESSFSVVGCGRRRLSSSRAGEAEKSREGASPRLRGSSSVLGRGGGRLAGNFVAGHRVPVDKQTGM